MRFSLISSALVAALVGYGASVALLLSAASAVHASAAQTASWVFTVCVGKAIGSAYLSYSYRVPVVLAWSTPGLALIAATSDVALPEAVGAFVLAGLLITLTGLLRPLGRLVGLIPDGIAAAMLAGVLLPFCLKIPAAALQMPAVVLPMIAIFMLVRLKNPALAVLAALALGLLLAFGFGTATLPVMALPAPVPVFIFPGLRWDVLTGLGLPLYLVTMASQNLPGFTTMRANGYAPPVRPALITTGLISTITGFFGAHTVSMAAITAAICMGDDVHPDREQRWKVGLAYGAVWLGLALLSPLILQILAVLPPVIMTALVALALLGPLMAALAGAFIPTQTRFAATITMVTTASGIAAFGIGAAFWGITAGLLIYAMEITAKRP